MQEVIVINKERLARGTCQINKISINFMVWSHINYVVLRPTVRLELEFRFINLGRHVCICFHRARPYQFYKSVPFPSVGHDKYKILPRKTGITL